MFDGLQKCKLGASCELVILEERNPTLLRADFKKHNGVSEKRGHRKVMTA